MVFSRIGGRCLMATALFVLVVFLGDAPAADSAKHSRPEVRVREQLVAVEDVCAWPKLALRPNGELIAAIYNKPSHGRLPGDIEAWASTDDGRTWRLRGTATAHQPHTNYNTMALGQAANGDLLIIAVGWKSFHAAQFRKGELLEPVVCRSADGGRTWVRSKRFPAAPDGRKLVPFGSIVAGADGNLRAALYTFGRLEGSPGRVDICYVAASEDDGRTWKIATTLGAPEASETHFVHLGKGTWLAATRNNLQERTVDLYRSDDDAAHWQRTETLTGPQQHPAHLLRLDDGRILLTYGDRTGPPFGVGIRTSDDRGRTWSPPVRIVNNLASWDCGYPATVQLADGTLVTAYYTERSEDFERYHMGVLRWELAEGESPDHRPE